MTAATLALLETTIERYGRDAVTDPVALEGSLRAATVAPPEPQIAALVEAAASGAVARLRAELDADASAVAALESVAGDDVAARWAVATTGAALGLLPRALALATTAPDGDVTDVSDTGGPADPTIRIATTGPADPTVDVDVAPAAASTAAPASGSGAGSAADAVGPADPTVDVGAASAAPGSGSAAGAVRPADPTVVIGTPAATPQAPDRAPADPTVDLATATGRAASTPDAGPAEPTVDVDTPGTRSPYRRRRVLIAGLGVAVLVVAVVVAAVLLIRPTAASVPMDAMPPPSGLAAPTPEPATTADPAPTATPEPAAPPADPRAAFRDPGLLALAEPYLAAEAGAICRAGEPSVNVQERVTCALPSGHAALFSRLLSVDVMRDLRAGFLEGPFAEPGTLIRSLRWKEVAGRPGVRTGIAPERNDPGEGLRIRYIDESGDPRLYFDRDACACVGYLGLAEPSGDDQVDLDELRAYWANPAR